MHLKSASHPPTRPLVRFLWQGLRFLWQGLAVIALTQPLVGSAQAQKAGARLNAAWESVPAARSQVRLGPPRNLTAGLAGAAVVLRWEAPEAPGAAPAPEREPNNQPSEAQRMVGPSPSVVSGDVQAAEVGLLSVTFVDGSVDDMEDLFLFTTTAPSGEVRLTGLTNDCDLYLLSDASGTLEIVGESLGLGFESESIDMAGLPAGTYLVGVSLFDPGQISLSSSYELTVVGSLENEALLGYRIYRSSTTNAAATGTAILETTAQSATDDPPTTGIYYYQVTALGELGESAPSNEVSSNVTTLVETDAPTGFALLANWPNPFNPSTRLAFELAMPGAARLEVLNGLGQVVATLIDSVLPAGHHEVSWSASGAPTGVYWSRLRVDGAEASRPMVLLR